MSHLLIPRRVTLDLITMQRSSNCCHQKMLLRVAQRRPVDISNDFHSSSSVCNQFVSLTRNKGTPLFASVRTVHTATSPSTGAHILLSTRWGRFTSQDDARRQVARLSAEERNHLEKAIEDIKKRNEEKLETEMEPPSGHQLRLLCYQNALPFIGFGFLDNVIMISVASIMSCEQMCLIVMDLVYSPLYGALIEASNISSYHASGEYIDTSIGITLGISTMAAAGIGNMISDLAGLGLADQVESLCRKLGIPNPNLSAAQLRHRSSRWMGLIGRCVGIIIGCTIGMAPLLWFDDPHKDSESCSVSSKDKH